MSTENEWNTCWTWKRKFESLCDYVTFFFRVREKYDKLEALGKAVLHPCLSCFENFSTKSLYSGFWATFSSSRESRYNSRACTSDQFARIFVMSNPIHSVYLCFAVCIEYPIILMLWGRGWHEFSLGSSVGLDRNNILWSELHSL